MRYASGVLIWNDGQLHPLETAIEACPAVTIDTSYQISRVGDRLVELCEFSGDMARLEQLLECEGSVHDFAVTRETGLAYVEYSQSPSMELLFDILVAYSLVLVPPLVYTDDYTDRGVRLTVVGTESAITCITADLPPEVDIYPESLGEYVPKRGQLVDLLTERQRTVFEAAVELGYYEVPREATHEEIAAAVGRAPATVSEQLQRIEANLLPRYLDTEFGRI
ncbi:transcriptional regulator (plasmid) [Haloferax mediterranei ATCC 33500]|uniref:Transcription regulator n=1 Tax=Haloferax mediterranei (strain ATCC 33500 / DSM 1411 / JCM 8866 / NBRC 14739 / NCIMB 2177 / R-4) TaxID=523841 RepID=I3RAH6_HALMT|nr:helix-turn-helix domain-containing protein [Haloferax mediterranei]AFK21236.1 transcription regulator [Haloferax mediterranei ATCC 33500]AHZ24660.1 transcriptional regulator [Haloferax mediterranei ATCC 33500]ELZ97434.1 transcriptional regulator [Haloferax mediterranei ATCC 33500]MDX5990273.1 helix-turn-helix domain-containing protein [Haloferax mediterranei ATCC 33500]QCQ77057.1 transcriptional regulator [Haloferax mediterranei ATCC 33500]